MSVTTINTKHELHIPSNFSIKDRTVSSNANHSFYVPAIHLPNEASTTISEKAFLVELSYHLTESVTEEVNKRGVAISKGNNTGRIFSLKASLSKPDFLTLINRMQDIRLSVTDIKNNTVSKIQKKNYELIISLVNKIIAKVMQDKNEIELKIFNS